MTIQAAPPPLAIVSPFRPSAAPVGRIAVTATTAPVMPPDAYEGPKVPPPPPPSGSKPSFWDRISPKELAIGIAVHVGGGALIAGGIGAGIAALAGGAALTGLAIGAGVGAVLGGVFLAAVLAMAG